MTQVNMISAAKRKSLPAEKFALPAQKKYPIDTAARVRNAAARLEQQKGSMPAADYAAAKKRIGAAAKHFGIKSEYNKKTAADGGDPIDNGHIPTAIGNRRPRKGLHMRIGPGGTYEVRHVASDAAAPEYGESVALADVCAKDAAPVWIQVAKVGQFAGHPAGPFRLDEKTFEQIVHNFRETQNRRVPIDFEHASEADATAGSIPVDGAPAQGWIVDLDNRGAQGLWALVEWGDKAREYIREGKYRYISPAVRFNSKDRVTGQTIGARLTSAGLTNQPFLDGMQPLAARDRPMLGTPLADHGQFMASMRQCLKLSELATYRECADHLGRLREMCMSAHAAGGDPMGAHEGVNLGDYIAPMKALMNMPANATLEQLFDAVEEMIDAAIERHEAIYHEGDDDDDPDSAPMADRTTGETAMAEPTITNKDQEALAEAQRKLKDAEAAKDKAEAQAAEHALKMKDIEAQLKTLSDAAAKRDAEDAARLCREQEARVTETIAVYADKKGLSEADRPNLLKVLKGSPDAFDALYPPVPAAQRHLLRNISATVAHKPATVVTMSGKRPDVPGHVELVEQPAVTQEGIARGRVLKALSGGASIEQAILMSNKAPAAAS